jgi:alanine racemase
MQPSHEKTWIEISGSALRANLEFMQLHVSPSQVIPVIKANAYGHGLKLVPHALAEAEVPFFAVDSIEEAKTLRTLYPQLPILILGYIPQFSLEEALNLSFSFVCSKAETIASLKTLTSMERPAKIHLEIETGLHRQGANPRELEMMLQALEGTSDSIFVEGICTHFANAEEPAVMNQYPMLQEERFLMACERVAMAGYTPKWRHAACSAAAWLRSTSCFDAIRLGISLYGIWSSIEVREVMHERSPELKLRPVMTWKTIIAETKTVASGEPIGYGLTERVHRETRLAVLPIGYADGFDRRLSSVGQVLIGGKRCRVLGRVCMNMIMVDVTELESVKLEDEVVIFGIQANDRLTPEDWEVFAPGLIAYEAVARLRQDIPRLLVV